MNFIDAIKSGRPCRRASWVDKDSRWTAYPLNSWDTSIGSQELAKAKLMPADIIANDWELMDCAVETTESHLWALVAESLKEEGAATGSILYYRGNVPAPGWEVKVIRRLAEKLGFFVGK